MVTILSGTAMYYCLAFSCSILMLYCIHFSCDHVLRVALQHIKSMQNKICLYKCITAILFGNQSFKIVS